MNKQVQQSINHLTKKRITFSCCSMLLTLFLCSCTTTNHQVSNDPFQRKPSHSGRSSVKLSLPTNKPQDNIAASFDKGVMQADAIFPHSSKPYQDKQVVSAHHTFDKSQHHTNKFEISTADFYTNSKKTFITPISHIKKSTHIRKVGAKSVARAIEYASPDPENHPDEYLWDGGDRDYPVHFDRFNRLGLETEDTVVEYSDHTGKRHMKPTNRVAIYAPRFNVVRSMSAPIAEASVDKVAGARSEKRIAGLNTETVATNHNQNIPSTNMRIRSRASGLESKDIQADFGQTTRLAQHEMLINTFEDIAFLHSGRFEKSDKPILAKAILAASTWSKDLYPIIQAQVDGVGQLEAKFQHNELVGTDNSHLKKGRLRIVKLADKKVALQGDVITFKIRYDNLGDLELHHIRIIDNLTPRLEYVEDSATSDLKGRLDVEENGEGSLVLKFVLEESLKGHTGGVITFQAKVR